ncbi:MAG: hypothetical protein AB1422_09365 [bacterium]
MSIKKALILGVVLGLLASKGFAQTQGTETVVGTETIEPALVLEYKSDEPIADVIFGETEMTVEEARALGMKGLEKKKVTETVKVQYPKVIFVEDENAQGRAKSIKFLDEKGRLKKEIPVQRWILGKQSAAEVKISENRKYIVVTTTRISAKPSDKPPYGISTDCIVINTEGDVLWKPKVGLFSYPPYVKVSSNGKYVFCSDSEWGEAPLDIFFDNGVSKRIERVGGIRIDGGGADITFSKDGSFCAIVVSTIDRKVEAKKFREREKKHLIVMDDKGNELWRKENIVEGKNAYMCRLKCITEDNFIIFYIGKLANSYIKETNARIKIVKEYWFDKNGTLIKSISREE